MLSQFPHEVRLNIFHHVFSHLWCRAVIRLEDTPQGIRFKVDSSDHEKDYVGALSCLDATVWDEGVAAAAAEALYQSEFTFGVGADILCTFLQNCPLSKAVHPGQYIKGIHLYMDEEPNFFGDGKTGQDLRKADWVDLQPGPSDDRTTRSTKRTQLMRQCWRAILNMPRLHYFDFLIMPSQPPVLRDAFRRFEIRDIIPMHFRLFCRNIDARIYVQIRDDDTDSFPDYELEARLFAIRHPNAKDGGFYESYKDISSCIPRGWNMPTAERLAEALATAVRLGGGPPVGWFDLYDSFKMLAVHHRGLFCQYHQRLVAGKSQYPSQPFNAKMAANML